MSYNEKLQITGMNVFVQYEPWKSNDEQFQMYYTVEWQKQESIETRVDDTKVRWFSIVNSLLSILFLGVCA